MRLFAVVGKPVGHSLSPTMHRAAYRALELAAEYVRIECEQQELSSLADVVRKGALSGVNITMPYKAAALRVADEASEDARLLGVANTWVRAGSRVIAHNTDGEGFLVGLRAKGGMRPGLAIVLGSGGAARAICLSLHRLGFEVVVLSRRPEEASKEFRLLGGSVLGWSAEDIPALAQRTCLVVNATPLGMEPHVDECPAFPLELLRETAVVYDIVYKPRKTKLLRRADALGLKTIEGLLMLAGQGARSFELWFGRPAPLAEMLGALENALGNNHIPGTV